jgi:hypothetical protein
MKLSPPTDWDDPIPTDPPAATPPAGDAELMQWLQDAPRRLRTTATPLADIIPRLQQAADRLTALSERVAALTRERDELSSANQRFAKRQLTDIDNLFRMEQRAVSAEARCAAMEPLFNKACAIVDAWDSPDMEHPLQGLRDAARAALAAKGEGEC